MTPEQPACGDTFAHCVCVLASGHEGAHACELLEGLARGTCCPCREDLTHPDQNECGCLCHTDDIGGELAAAQDEIVRLRAAFEADDATAKIMLGERYLDRWESVVKLEQRIAELESAVEILGSMVAHGHEMTPESQETMRAKAAGIIAALTAQETPDD